MAETASDPKKPFGVTPGFVVTGKLPPEEEQQRSLQAGLDARDQAVMQHMLDQMAQHQSIFNSLLNGKAISDQRGNTINFGKVTPQQAEDIATLMTHGAPIADVANLGIAKPLDEEEAQAPTLGEMGQKGVAAAGNMRNAVAAQVARELEDLGNALMNSGIPSTMGDVPLDALMQQVRGRAPQFAAQLQQLQVTAQRALTGYQEWATMQGADEEDKTPLQAFPGYTEFTFNNLMQFYDQAGQYL